MRLGNIVRQMDNKVDDHKKKLQAVHIKLRAVVRQRAEQLLKYIFPITEVIPASRR
jgi:hypothetical protein